MICGLDAMMVSVFVLLSARSNRKILPVCFANAGLVVRVWLMCLYHLAAVFLS
jgi:hypothetical protein